jgi:hypothetical protein
MDKEEEILILLVGAGTIDDPYGTPIDMVARTFKCDRSEAEAWVKELEAAGTIRRKPTPFKLQRDGEEIEYIKYNWVRPEEDWEESLGDVIALP